MESHATFIDAAIVVIYFAVVLAVGYYSSKRATDSDGYLVAGQRLGYFMTFACLSASLLGGASTIGTASLGYQFGISGMWMVFMLGTGLGLVGLLIYRRVRKFRVLTVGELLTKRFGVTAGVLSAIVSALYCALVCATQVIAMGTILQAIMGWSSAVSMVVVIGIVIVYSLMGGMWSVSLTDFIQFFLITIGILFVMLPFGLNAAGGFSGLQATVPTEYWNIGNIGMDRIIQYFFLYCLGIIVGQDIWQRYLTAKNVKVARVGGVASAAYIIVYGIACALIGMAAFVVLGGDMETPSLAFATLANTTVPTGLLGVVLTAVLAVLMSTASCDLIAATTLIGTDVIEFLRKDVYARETPEEKDKRRMRTTRITMVFVGLFAMLVAVALQDVLVALDVSYAVLSGALFFPIILALFWKKATPHAAIIAILGGSLAVFGGMAIFGLTAIEPIAIGLVVSAVLMVAVSLYETRDGGNSTTSEESLAMFDYPEEEDGSEKIFA